MTDLLASYAAQRRRGVILICALAFVAVAALLIDIASGPAMLAPIDLIKSLLSPGNDGATDVIVWQIRLPVALLASGVGASLAIAGVEMQVILRNPLAEPFILGVSSFAALGAALAAVGLALPFLPTVAVLPAQAFIGALVAILILHLFGTYRRLAPDGMVLLGVALGFIGGTALSLLQFMVSADALQQIVFWQMGGLGRATLPQAAIVAMVLLIAAFWSYSRANATTLMHLGEDRVRMAGVDVARLRRGALLRASLLAAIAVAFTGVIGFVGLAAPHLARRLVGGDHRLLMPAAGLTGAIILSFSSTLSKLILHGSVLPVGIITAVVGLPVFLWMLISQYSEGK